MIMEGSRSNGYEFWVSVIIRNTRNGIGRVEQKTPSGWCVRCSLLYSPGGIPLSDTQQIVLVNLDFFYPRVRSFGALALLCY